MTPAAGGGGVRVEIGTLILDGLPPVDAGLVAAAVQQELARLLAAEPLTPEQAAAPPAAELRAGPVQLAPGDDAGRVGVKIGRALHAALRPAPAATPRAGGAR